MLDRLFQLPLFYALLFVLIPIGALFQFIPNTGFDSQLHTIYTLFISLLFFCSFLLWEEFLFLEIKKSLQRKLLTLILLYAASVPASLLYFSTQANVEFLLLLCLIPAFLTGIVKTFYFKRSSLISCIFPSILIGLIEPTLLIFMVLLVSITFQKEKEKSFFLFASFTLPPIFLQIHNYELTSHWFSPSFFQSHSLLFDASITKLPQAILTQLTGFLSIPVLMILFVLLWGYFLINPIKWAWKKSLVFCSLLSLPLCSFFQGGALKPSMENILCVLSLSFLILSFPKFKEWFLNSPNFSSRLVCLLGILCLSYPFYTRAVGFTSPPSIHYEASLP